MLNPEQRRFLEHRRLAHLATADKSGRPHVVPVCFALKDDNVYLTMDDKPKRVPSGSLKRLHNIRDNPSVALVADHYDDQDWARLGWVMVRGRAQILDGGDEHAAAQALLRARYAQMAGMALETHPVIAIRIENVASWGSLLVSCVPEPGKT